MGGPRRLDQLAEKQFDLLVVGGGITGACAAWNAAHRGLSVALIDAADFASGASSNSLKLVHGGLRYLKRLLPREAREAIHERRAWLRTAPHLIEPIPVLVPLYRRGVQSRPFVRMLLAANDVAGWDRNKDVDESRRIPAARMLTLGEALNLAPVLEGAGVVGGALFYDAQIQNTERLVLEVVRAAAEAGATVVNYVELEQADLARGRVVGARLKDRLGGVAFRLRTRAILNATGSATADVIRRLCAGHAYAAAPAYSGALNVMIPARSMRVALAFRPDMAGSGGERQLLWVPWRDRELVGTYHWFEPGNSGVQFEDRHVADFVAEVNHALPAASVDLRDVVLVHAGFLPVSRPSVLKNVPLLQRHRLIDHAAHGADGALTLISVKYTTARLAAAEAVDLVLPRLGRTAESSRPAPAVLPSAPESVSATFEAAMRQNAGHLERDIVEHLVRTYGARYPRVIAQRDELAPWMERVHSDSPVIHAELLYGVREELACTADDLLWRRTELASRGLSSAGVVERAAAVIVREHGAGAHPCVPRRPPFLRSM